MEGCEKIV